MNKLNDLQVELIDATKDGNLYDFIACNYWKMEKVDIARCLLELAFATYEFVGLEDYEQIEAKVSENLQEIWGN